MNFRQARNFRYACSEFSFGIFVGGLSRSCQDIVKMLFGVLFVKRKIKPGIFYGWNVRFGPTEIRATWGCQDTVKILSR